MSYWILKGKQPDEVGMLEWSQWHLNTDLSVASTMFEGVLISTIFLAKDFRIGLFVKHFRRLVLSLDIFHKAIVAA